MKRKATSDVFDINKNTGALILGSNRLDDYASKFLTKYCKEALLEPMPLPVEDIIQKMQLTVQEVALSENLDIFGCCLLLDSDVKVYDRDKNEYKDTFFKAGTILIDSHSSAFYGEALERNTLVHEMLHWEKDRRYFEILNIKNKRASEKLYPIMCRQSKTFFKPAEGKKTKENEVQWLEWQAHRLAPRILMPRNPFKKKALSLIEENPNISCSELVEEISVFFVVSKSSAKYRLLEVQLEETLKKFADYHDVYFDVEGPREFISLAPIDAFKMMEENPVLRSWVRTGNFIYVDGYFVLSENKNIRVDSEGNLRLSDSVRRNLSRSVINIREFRFTGYANSDAGISKFALLKKNTETDKRLLVFHPHFQSNLNLNDEGQIYSLALEEISNKKDREFEKV